MPDPIKITAAASGAFVQLLKLEPTGSGPLDGLRFGVKDLFDLGGYVTGGGNPDWATTHPPAAVNAVSVEQLLAAGATCIGKTVSDELAFSLDGENFFYGTPLNPRAPDRVPGGSSSGSASAVACGLADFALGTDTGGSVRVPASNCGLYGLRPSHGLISVAGILPFAPTFDTVGILANSSKILAQVAAVLLSLEVPPPTRVGKVHILQEALDLCDPEVRQALAEPLRLVRELLGIGCGRPPCGRSTGSPRLPGSPPGTTPFAPCSGPKSGVPWGVGWKRCSRPSDPVPKTTSS